VGTYERNWPIAPGGGLSSISETEAEIDVAGAAASRAPDADIDAVMIPMARQQR